MSIQSIARTAARRTAVVLATLLVIALFVPMALWDGAEAGFKSYGRYRYWGMSDGVFHRLALTAEVVADTVAEDWWVLTRFLRYDVPAAWARA